MIGKLEIINQHMFDSDVKSSLTLKDLFEMLKGVAKYKQYCRSETISPVLIASYDGLSSGITVSFDMDCQVVVIRVPDTNHKIILMGRNLLSEYSSDSYYVFYQKKFLDDSYSEEEYECNTVKMDKPWGSYESYVEKLLDQFIFNTWIGEAIIKYHILEVVPPSLLSTSEPD